MLESLCPRADDPLLLHSFPTRRSSDLVPATETLTQAERDKGIAELEGSKKASLTRRRDFRKRSGILSRHRTGGLWRNVRRSEEHTSELQSLTNLVCRLLLEKKKHRKTC